MGTFAGQEIAKRKISAMVQRLAGMSDEKSKAYRLRIAHAQETERSHEQYKTITRLIVVNHFSAIEVV